MKKFIFIIFIIIGGFFSFNKFSSSKSTWKNSIGYITNVTKLSENTYGCQIEYTVEIKGKIDSIKQFYMDLKKEPINNQNLQLKYNSEEPIEYILVEKIQYKK